MYDSVLILLLSYGRHDWFNKVFLFLFLFLYKRLKCSATPKKDVKYNKNNYKSTK